MSEALDLFGRTPFSISIALLREYAARGEPYWLAFSGGKDSVALHQVAVEAGVKFEPVYNVTTCDPPELVWFIRRQYPHVRFLRSPRGRTLINCMEVEGPPLRTNRWCCEEFKHSSGAGRWVLTGIRDAESGPRRARAQVESCYRNPNTMYLHPIKHWSTDYLWWFIRDRGLPYCKLYDEGFDRLGCVICPEKSREETTRCMERWPRIFALAKRALTRCYERPGRHALHAAFPSADELWRWWIARDESWPARGLPLAEHRGGQTAMWGEGDA